MCRTIGSVNPLSRRIIKNQTAGYLEKFDVVQLNMWSNKLAVTTPHGGKTMASQWADDLDIKYAPSMVFFNVKGKADQLELSLSEVPLTYGDYLIRLHKEGAKFYINKRFLIVAGIAPDPDKDLGKVADYAKNIFKPVSFKEMLMLRKKAYFDYSY